MTLSPDDFAQIKQETIAPAREVLEHLHQAVLSLPAFTLKDGTTARVEAYEAPQVNDEGEWSCGVDVVLSNGTQLEFTLRNTGWGKSFAEGLGKSQPQRGRRR